MDQPKLGTVPTESDGRDAVHVAIIPVRANELLQPGEHVGLRHDGLASVSAAKDIGVVDPFRKTPVKPGERFWLCLYPQSITSLRHVWAHPDFTEEPR
jgi:hemin uptake protein HemP